MSTSIFELICFMHAQAPGARNLDARATIELDGDPAAFFSVRGKHESLPA
jgi:hypothetical protein